MSWMPSSFSRATWAPSSGCTPSFPRSLIRLHSHREPVHFLQAPHPTSGVREAARGVDLSKVVLTHHKLTSKGPKTLALGGEGEKLKRSLKAARGRFRRRKRSSLLNS